jgi:hypothetical protein
MLLLLQRMLLNKQDIIAYDNWANILYTRSPGRGGALLPLLRLHNSKIGPGKFCFVVPEDTGNLHDELRDLHSLVPCC